MKINSRFNKNSKSKIEYHNLPSAIRPMLHSDEIPVLVFEQPPPVEVLSDVEECSHSSDADFEIYKDLVLQFLEFLDQHELDDLERDLGISEKAPEILAPRLNKKNLLEQGVVLYF